MHSRLSCLDIAAHRSLAGSGQCIRSSWLLRLGFCALAGFLLFPSFSGGKATVEKELSSMVELEVLAAAELVQELAVVAW